MTVRPTTRWAKMALDKSHEHPFFVLLIAAPPPPHNVGCIAFVHSENLSFLRSSRAVRPVLFAASFAAHLGTAMTLHMAAEFNDKRLGCCRRTTEY